MCAKSILCSRSHFAHACSFVRVCVCVWHVKPEEISLNHISDCMLTRQIEIISVSIAYDVVVERRRTYIVLVSKWSQRVVDRTHCIPSGRPMMHLQISLLACLFMYTQAQGTHYYRVYCSRYTLYFRNMPAAAVAVIACTRQQQQLKKRTSFGNMSAWQPNAPNSANERKTKKKRNESSETSTKLRFQHIFGVCRRFALPFE